jgi:hypothetical protein
MVGKWCLLFRLLLPAVIAAAFWLAFRIYFPMSSPVGNLLNLMGTAILAFSIDFPESKGGGLRGWLVESLEYRSSPSFSPLNFYLGLALLGVGILLSSSGF